ncbi:MAG: hypothetical protein AAFN16_27400, partial [Pseudomonadota bacterium]
MFPLVLQGKTPYALRWVEHRLITPMILRLATLLAALCAATVSHADSIPKPGDYYLISRDHSGKFLGSHKLFKKESADLKQVTYCGHEYFVRESSVAWTELEAEFGRIVHVEFNFGKGWRPICAHPEREVTLADLGITMDAREVLANRCEPVCRRGTRRHAG